MADVDNWIKKYVGFVDKVLEFIPYGRMKVWKDFFFNPTTVLTKNLDSIGDRVKDLYAAQIIGFIIGVVAAVPALVVVGITPVGLATAGIGLPLIVGIVLVILLVAPLLTVLYAGLEFLVAKVLGGKANFTAHLNASVLPFLAGFAIGLPINILLVPFQWVSVVPLVSICVSIATLPLSIVLLLIGLYELYLKYVAFKEVHKLSQWRSIGVVFLPVFLVLILAIILAMALWAVLAVFFMSSIGAAPGGYYGPY